MTVPLGNQPDLAEIAGLPWCSVAILRSGEEAVHRVVGPGSLPILFSFTDPDTTLEEYQKEAAKLRRSWGLEPESA